MAFHIHLIDPFWDHLQHNRGCRPQADRVQQRTSSTLSLRWDLGDDGCVHACWARD